MLLENGGEFLFLSLEGALQRRDGGAQPPQLVEAGVKEVMIRYKRLTQVCAIKVKP